MASVGAGAWAAAGAGAAVAAAVLPVFAAFAAVSASAAQRLAVFLYGHPALEGRHQRKKTQDTRGEGGCPPGAKTQNTGGVGGCYALALPG